MADDFDIRAHQQMWSNFIRIANYSLVGVALVLILMAIFLL